MRTQLISAICTPLNNEDSLHVDGLAAHLDDQWRNGISGVLIAGTMGLMQLLDDDAYRDLVRHGVQMAHGRGEVLVGVGDTSYKRTLHRIQYVEQYDIDGVVVLAPYFYQFGQADLINYYRDLADQSKKPLYLYDLPARTKTKLELETVLQLSQHPNIHGIKCSDEWTTTRRLMARVGDDFRVVPAQPQLVDELIRCGIRSNLDGIFAVVPDLTASIAEAAERADWTQAASRQQELTELLHLLCSKYPLFPACSAILNARGIGGKFFPMPLRPLEPRQQEQLLAEPLIHRLLNKARPAS